MECIACSLVLELFTKAVCAYLQEGSYATEYWFKVFLL